MKVAAYVTLISSQWQLAGTEREREWAPCSAGRVRAESPPAQLSLVTMIPVTRCDVRA